MRPHPPCWGALCPGPNVRSTPGSPEWAPARYKGQPPSIPVPSCPSLTRTSEVRARVWGHSSPQAAPVPEPSARNGYSLANPSKGEEQGVEEGALSFPLWAQQLQGSVHGPPDSSGKHKHQRESVGLSCPLPADEGTGQADGWAWHLKGCQTQSVFCYHRCPLDCKLCEGRDW